MSDSVHGGIDDDGGNDNGVYDDVHSDDDNVDAQDEGTVEAAEGGLWCVSDIVCKLVMVLMMMVSMMMFTVMMIM